MFLDNFDVAVHLGHVLGIGLLEVAVLKGRHLECMCHNCWPLEQHSGPAPFLFLVVVLIYLLEKPLQSLIQNWRPMSTHLQLILQKVELYCVKQVRGDQVSELAVELSSPFDVAAEVVLARASGLSTNKPWITHLLLKVAVNLEPIFVFQVEVTNVGLDCPQF